MSIRNRIVVVDYGMGNIHSIVKKIKHLGGDVFVSSNSKEMLKMVGKHAKKIRKDVIFKGVCW